MLCSGMNARVRVFDRALSNVMLFQALEDGQGIAKDFMYIGFFLDIKSLMDERTLTSNVIEFLVYI